jgi:flagellar hook-associated protein 1
MDRYIEYARGGEHAVTSTFFGLQTAKRGLLAQQTAISVVNHNIANANTPGYSRQVATMTTTPPYSVPALNRDGTAGQLGTGVDVTTVRRVRDTFVDYQLRKESASQGRWDAQRDGLEQVEAVFNEPSTSGVSTLLARFWGSWQTVANSPDDPGARGALVEQGKALADSIQYDYRQLEGFRADANSQVQMSVDEVNVLSSRIAELNGQISQVELNGERANDLADQRDLLVDQLNGIAKVSVAIAPNGMAQVYLGNRMLVDGMTANRLKVGGYRDPANPSQVDSNNPYSQVQWDDNIEPPNGVAISDGKLKGLLDLRDVNLPGYEAKLDLIARKVMAAVNAVHQTGYGVGDTARPNPPRPFFTGLGAADIAINAEIVADPKKVAASSLAGAAGNGDIALRIAAILKGTIPSGVTVTYTDLDGTTKTLTSTDDGNGALKIEGEYQQFISVLGIDARAASETSDNQKVLVDHLQSRRDALSGVSLDEETMNLIKYQQAYQASARVVSTIDSMLDTLINKMGV